MRARERTPSATASSRSPGRARGSCSSAWSRTTSRGRRSRSSARGTSRSAAVPTLTLRVSYVGELGFELHHPVEHQRDALRPAAGGGRAARARRLRLPRARVDAAREGLPALGRGHVRRLHAARGGARAVRAPSTRATSSAATRCCASASEGVRRTLACLDRRDGRTPTRTATSRCCADGTPIGYVAAGGYGHVVEQSIALAYLPVEHAEPGTRLDGRDPRRAAVRRSWCRSRSTIRRTCGCSRDDSRTNPSAGSSFPATPRSS